MNPKEEQQDLKIDNPQAESNESDVAVQKVEEHNTKEVHIDSESGAVSMAESVVNKGEDMQSEPEVVNEPSEARDESEDLPSAEAEEEESVAENHDSQKLNEDMPSSSEEKVESNGSSVTAENPMAIKTNVKKSSNTPKAAIVVAAVIGIALIIVSVVAYFKMKDTQAPNSASQDNQTSEQKSDVSGADVDSAVQDVDSEINKTNDVEDIPTEESVSDSTLGL